MQRNDHAIAARREEVRALATEILGPVVSVEHEPFGHACVTFTVTDERQNRYIFKTGERGCFDHTQANISILGELGIPTPRVITKSNRGDFDFLVLERVPGRDLRDELPTMSRDQLSRLAAKIVRFQRRVMSLPHGEGFGWTPIGVPGPFRSWTEIVERDAAAGPPELHRALDSLRADLARVAATPFLDDITVKNVIVDRGELGAIIDLDFVCYGDPLYWLSLTEATVMLDIGLDGGFYPDELKRLWGLSPSQSRVNALYGAVHGFSFIRRAGPHDPWKQRMEDWTDRCLIASLDRGR
jgi:aminoglycoside phosphotransferase (APT) family kinase protein